jgi:diguanylate cyclase (GGDEF)-like protein
MKQITNELLRKFNNNWIQFMKALTNELKDIVITGDDFQEVIRAVVDHPKSNLKGVEIIIYSSTTSFEPSTYGVKPEGEPHGSEIVDLDSVDWFKYKISIWKRDSIPNSFGFNIDEIKRAIKDLVFYYWKSDLRGEKTHLITTQSSGTKEILQKTVEHYHSSAKYMGFFCSDVDKFKEVNTEFGLEGGDKVILQMSMFFYNILKDIQGVINIHRTGDEFFFLVFADDVETILKVAYTLKKQLEGFQFDVKDKEGNIRQIKKSITIGIYIHSAEKEEIPDFDASMNKAEFSMKTDAGDKRYGQANVTVKAVPTQEPQAVSNLTLSIAKILIKTCTDQKTFSNVWLNLIAFYVHEGLKKHGNVTGIKELLQWVHFDFSNVCHAAISDKDEVNYSKQVSSYDVMMAVARGVLLYDSQHERDIDYSIETRSSNLVLLQSSDEVLSIVDDQSFTEGIKIGSANRPSMFPTAILVKIGHDKIACPKDLFCEIITVDDRPSKGGGLPDFWEASLARLVASIEQFPYVTRVYVYGDFTHATKTVEILKRLREELNPVEFEEIVFKIGVPNQMLRDSIDRVLEKGVYLFDDFENLINDYAAFTTKGTTIKTPISEASYLGRPRFLDKHLNLEKYSLGNEDGFKVPTLSEAFPLMLEIARKASLSKEIIDQAGVSLGELIDFKVELSNPTFNTVPYYYRKETQSFDQYFKFNFLDIEKGLFAKHLGDQLDIVINHVVDAIQSDSQYATRRAILIIPNKIEIGEDLSPLGLVSIRIIPRYDEKGNVFLSFSYTWRTVEALVGFPYSVYGSIKYSEYLTSLIIERLPANRYVVFFDKLSYIAHSLHIFLDNFGQNIAKRIADDATI